MDKISNSHIYEFMENLYDEVEKRDGGYYPSKHDRYIAEEASKKFRKPIEEIDEI